MIPTLESTSSHATERCSSARAQPQERSVSLYPLCLTSYFTPRVMGVDGPMDNLAIM